MRYLYLLLFMAVMPAFASEPHCGKLGSLESGSDNRLIIKLETNEGSMTFNTAALSGHGLILTSMMSREHAAEDSICIHTRGTDEEDMRIERVVVEKSS